jgi:6-phosphogluconate dehydrogenase (decarboxylating)
MDRFRKFVIKLLPYRVVEWYRRKRSIRRYMKGLSVEVLERDRRLEHLEGRIASSQRGFYHQIVTDVLERTDIILQELDRRVEGLAARTEESVASIEAQVRALREEVAGLREELGLRRDRDEAARSSAVSE